ncbi:hypothetical protein PRK78_000738 [Emydomyces testavorans]|uniref:C2 NT-type domain-containing protein n=1 Tax=Emydomyces testavorans TaxID=2070801 RepID=A0AAF0DC00_9EURO|nr:hypothetical protein PRK78_000738 [Emydomyces testavorans]
MDSWGFVGFAASELTNAISVPKGRRPKFTLTLRIIDIINVPLTVGTAYVKWQLPSSASAENSGETSKVQLQVHRASWGYEKHLTVRLMVDRNQMLQDCMIHFGIFQEFSPNSRSDKSLLGNIDLNLAEYVDEGDTEEGVVRRYLMQNSKINATVKVGIMMHQFEGDSNFIAPPLRPATVFSGIAGFMTAAKGDSDDPGRVPSFHHRSQQFTELQDLYFRNLAASWACRAGELPPDQLIEDIFAGGDGWASGRPSLKLDDDDEDTGSLSDTDSRRTGRNRSPAHSTRSGNSLGSHLRNRSKHLDFSFNSDIGGKDQKRTEKRRKNREVDEFEVREDLRSWEISWAK